MIPPQITLRELATTSLLVSISIAVFLPLRPLLRRVIGSRWLCVLWLALLIRLLIPWPLESRWSLFNHWQNDRTPATAAVAAETLKIKVSFPKDAHTAIPAAALPAVASPAMDSHWDLSTIANLAWLAGAALSLGILAWRWLQTRRLASNTRPVGDDRLRNIFEAIPQELRRDTQLRMTDALHVATLAGIFRPQIWMPVAWPAQFTNEELRNVLLHELGHARRGDLGVQWLFALAQCVHWFNPLVWLTARAARLDREMACDAWVLSRAGSSQAGYGATLMKTVRFLRPGPRMACVQVAMASSRRGLHTRISGIGAFKPMPAWRGLAAACACAVALAVLTTGRSAAQEKQPPAAAPQESGTAHAAGPAAQPAPPAPAPAAAPKPTGPQVAVNTDFFEISDADAKKLGLIDLIGAMDAKQLGYKETVPAPGEKSTPGGGVLDKAVVDALLAKLNKTASVKLLSAPSVTTISGQRAVIEIVREFRYPTEFDVDKKTGKATPTAFETRNTGITLEAEPRITPEHRIQLFISPQIVTFLGFMNYGENGNGTFIKATPNENDPDSPDSSVVLAQTPKGGILQPFFSTRKITTLVTLTSGQSVLLGGLRSEQTKGRLIFFLMSATIVEDQDKNAAPATGGGN